jgi:hypothetical protein
VETVSFEGVKEAQRRETLLSKNGRTENVRIFKSRDLPPKRSNISKSATFTMGEVSVLSTRNGWFS